ncbi:hypothetical protein FQN50_007441 [Emmonsiellopsis sp. PD_5]|nr:hypothetical protein FQN50_007441 [Emmonsiellopsis sp. PD_5]
MPRTEVFHERGLAQNSKCTRPHSPPNVNHDEISKLDNAAEMDSEGSKDKKPIPKFASFRPKISSAPSADDKSRRETEEGKPSRRHERSRHGSRHSTHTDHSRPRKADRTRYASRRTEDIEEHAPPEPLERTRYRPSKPDEQELFTVDRKGDKYNVTYGTLHRYSIPRYYRASSGRVLGLPPRYRIDRDELDGSTVVIRQDIGGYDGSKHKNRDILRKQARKDIKLYRVRQDPQNNPVLDSQKDFLPLSCDGARKRRRLYSETSSRESTPDRDALIDYRSIEGKAKLSGEPPEDLELVSDSSLDLDDENSRRRNAELSRRVTENPEDVDGWLQLINHQESLVGVAESDGQRRLTSAERRSVADIKISMYEKALNKVPSKAPRDRLLIGMMEEASKLWDTKMLSDRWKSILQANPDYTSLWIKYLDFQQTRFLTFTYEQCRSVFIDCLKINGGRENTREKDAISIYLILRLSLFMEESGFTEHAVALWQAILEFNFFRPNTIDVAKGLDHAMSSFSEFWDCEAARIGEIGAKGWDKGENSAPEAKSDAPNRDINDKSVFESWEQSERHRICHSRLPARTLDDVQEDDPYRVILSSDITDFLILSDSGDLLLDAFLVFCRLPPLASDKNSKILAQWRGDPFVRNSLLDQFGGQSSVWFSDLARGSEDSIQDEPNAFPLHTFANSSDTLFGNQAWFSELRIWQNTYMAKDGPLDGEWVRRALRHLVNRLPRHDDLAEYTVALEFLCNNKEAKRYAKNLLKKHSSNLRLYNAYALMELRSGQTPTAEHVWTTALSMSDNFSEEDKIDNILLWRTWIWEMLDQHNDNKAVQLLLAIPNGTIDPKILSTETKSPVFISPAEFLKTQRFLTASQEYGLSSRKPNIFVSSTECLALLAYLARNPDIDAAVNTYAIAHSRLSSHKLETTIFSELLLQAKAKLLYHHATSTRIYKPSLLRTELAHSISLFSQNTIFLSLFAWNESRFRIEDRVRSVMRQHTKTTHPPDPSGNLTTSLPTQSTLIPHIFTIYTELHRGVSAGSTAHSVRAAFEAALAPPPSGVQASASIWKLYILFELALSQRERAREVFYRAIRACPWAKELVLLAFREQGLREAMGGEELRKVWNVLVEKELRVHVDLEERFEERGEEGGERKKGGGLPFEMPVDESSEDEAEGG